MQQLVLSLLYFIYGIISGMIFYPISVKLIEKRVPENNALKKIKSKPMFLIFTGFTALAFVLISVAGITGSMIYYTMLLSSICISIAFIDEFIQKIPNLLLLAMMLTKAAFIVINNDYLFLLKGLIGFFAGFIIFILPSMLRIPIGAGDIKYAAAAGFCFGLYNLLQAMFIMSILIFIFLIILILTKKGGIKTSVPMGPYISGGIILTMLFPIF